MRRDHAFNSERNTRGPERTPADQRENCALRFISRAQTAVATEVGVPQLMGNVDCDGDAADASQKNQLY